MNKYIRIKEERNSIIKILENLSFDEKKQVLRKVDKSMIDEANKVLANDSAPSEYLTKLPTKFKSELKVGIDILENSKLSYSYSHISNNEWGDTNPGTDNQQITFSKNF